MREVEGAAVADLGPAHARHAALVEPQRPAGHEAEPVDAAVLVRPVERELQTQADAEHRASRRDARSQRLVVAALAQARHRGARRADARQDGEIGVSDVVDDPRAEALERELDRADVAGAVLADRDLHSRPFVDGSPAPSRAPRRAAHGRPP